MVAESRGASKPQNLFAAFQAVARGAAADRGFCFEGAAHLSHRGLCDAAERLAHWLAARGLRAGDVVAIFLPSQEALLRLHLANMRLGLITLPIHRALKAAELQHLLADSQARAVLSDAAGLDEVLTLLPQLPHLRWLISTEKISPAQERQRSAHSTTRPATTRPATRSATQRSATPSSASPETETESLALHVLPPRDAQLADRQGDLLPPLSAIDAEDVALILYTSGTTGRPKGAPLSHRNILSNMQAVIESWQITSRDRLLLTLPLFHAHGLVMGVHSMLLSGGDTLVQTQFDADHTLIQLEEAQCTMFMGVPTHYFRFLQSPRLKSPQLGRRALRGMRLFTSGSAPLDAITWRAFHEQTGHGIVERYGLSETLFNTTNPVDGPCVAGTVGLPFPGVELRLLNEEGRAVTPGAVGSIQVRGANVFAGYLRRPEATAAAFSADGWFDTGDLGRRRQDNGYLEILGRSKDLIISGGYNVYPAEVENALLELDAIAECAVIGKPSAEWGEVVHAVVVLRTGIIASHDLTEQLLAAASRSLADYKRPRSLAFASALPRNAMGKVQKKLLRETLAEAPHRRIQGMNPTEEASP